jgi:hypothetical protein
MYVQRMKGKILQKQLSRGICSQATISKIELGTVEGSFFLTAAILERIGCSKDSFEIMLDVDEYNIYEKEQVIKEAFKNRSEFDIVNLLREYQQLVAKDSIFSKQFIAWSKAKIGMLTASSKTEEVVKRLKYALSLTKTEVIIRCERCIYSRMELEILLTLAAMYLLSGQLEKANMWFLHLKKYVEEHGSLEIEDKVLPLIVLGIAQIYYQKDGYHEVLLTVDEVLVNASPGYDVFCLAELHFIYAKSLRKLALLKNEADQNRNKCISHCLQAYYLFQFAGNNSDIVAAYLKEELQWQCIK